MVPYFGDCSDNYIKVIQRALSHCMQKCIVLLSGLDSKSLCPNEHANYEGL